MNGEKYTLNLKYVCTNVCIRKRTYIRVHTHKHTLTEIYIHIQRDRIHTYVYCRNVMDIVIGNREPSSNPAQCSWHFTNAYSFGKSMNPTILPLTMGKIVGQTGLFDFGITAGQRKGKL